MNELERVKNHLKEHCRSMITASHYNQLPDDEFEHRIQAMLDDPSVAILADNQELPERSHWYGHDIFDETQQAMIDDNFKRVIDGLE